MKKIILFFLFCEFLWSANVQVITKSTYTCIGENFPVQIKIQHAEDEIVKGINFPDVSNMIFEKKKHKKGEIEDEIKISIKFLDLGEVQVPSFNVILVKNAKEKILKTGIFKIEVKGNLKEKDMVLKGLKGQIKESNWIIWLILMAILGVFFLILFKRKKTPVVEKILTPEEWYLEELKKIDYSLPQEKIFDFISDAFRIYLEKKFKIPAIYMSTSEIMKVLKEKNFPISERNRVSDFLKNCDFVKFAAGSFSDNEIKNFVKTADEFVKIRGGKTNEHPGA